jgi:hypothetical protein
MRSIKSYIPKIIKNTIKRGVLTKSFLKEETNLTSDQETILKAKESLDKPPSVLFFTTHKCASTFIPPLFKTITRNSNYKIKDYAGAIWELGDKIDLGQDQELFSIPKQYQFLEEAADELFFKRGDIYVPLRWAVDFPERNRLKHIFFLRDPRDVLVSSYYSLGFTHAWPKNSKSRKHFQAKRKFTQQKGIDNYVLSVATSWLGRYLKYKQLLETSNSYLYLKYDHFQSDTTDFIKQIIKYLDICVPNQEIEKLSLSATPIQAVKDNTKHKRSGKSKQYLEELKPETVEELNKTFKDILSYWQFEH